MARNRLIAEIAVPFSLTLILSLSSNHFFSENIAIIHPNDEIFTHYIYIMTLTMTIKKIAKGGFSLANSEKLPNYSESCGAVQ